MSADTAATPAAKAADLLQSTRTRAPLVQAITNSVVTGFTANVLLALGAAPAMVDIPDETGMFARIADGVLINLGTPTGEQRAAAREAVAAATEAGTPWVLDPVAVGALPVRTALAHELVAARPTVIRGNASEILAVAGAGAGGRGVDATDDPESALDAARDLAVRTGGVVAVSGPVDVLTDGIRVVRASNGDPLLTRVTGGGCALGAVMAAFLGGAPAGAEPLDAVVAAVTTYNLAAERAAEVANGPGSFAVAFLDALAGIQPSDVAECAVIS